MATSGIFQSEGLQHVEDRGAEAGSWARVRPLEGCLGKGQAEMEMAARSISQLETEVPPEPQRGQVDEGLQTWETLARGPPPGLSSSGVGEGRGRTSPSPT